MKCQPAQKPGPDKVPNTPLHPAGQEAQGTSEEGVLRVGVTRHVCTSRDGLFRGNLSPGARLEGTEERPLEGTRAGLCDVVFSENSN